MIVIIFYSKQSNIYIIFFNLEDGKNVYYLFLFSRVRKGLTFNTRGVICSFEQKYAKMSVGQKCLERRKIERRIMLEEILLIINKIYVCYLLRIALRTVEKLNKFKFLN